MTAGVDGGGSGLTAGEVVRVAGLARLAVSEERAGELVGELGAVLRHAERLESVDVGGVEPMAHCTDHDDGGGDGGFGGGAAGRWDDDRAVAGMDGAAVRANAPEVVGGEVAWFFGVPRVLGGGDGGGA